MTTSSPGSSQLTVRSPVMGLYRTAPGTMLEAVTHISSSGSSTSVMMSRIWISTTSSILIIKFSNPERSILGASLTLRRWNVIVVSETIDPSSALTIMSTIPKPSSSRALMFRVWPYMFASTRESSEMDSISSEIPATETCCPLSFVSDKNEVRPRLVEPPSLND